MFEKIRHDDFLKAHDELRANFHFKLRHNSCEGAKKHLQNGLIVRLAMMQEAILTFDRKLGNSDEPLDHDLAIQLTLYLNAYYLNLAGSLDNLAWALAYQHRLIDGDENNFHHPQRIGLANDFFLNLLKENNLESLRSFLATAKSWYKDIQQFRNPAAHRIPLYVPPAIWSEDDVQHSNELDEQAARLISGGDWEKGRDLMHQSHQVGKHEPIFLTTGSAEIQAYDLARQINCDHGMFLKVIKNVLQEGF